MMKKIEAQTLEEALMIAAKALDCSVIDLEYEIIQNPSKGFLGIGKKQAIICAQLKNNVESENKSKVFTKESEKDSTQEKILLDSTKQVQFYEKKSKKSPPTKEELQEISQVVKQELDTLLGMLPYQLNDVVVEPYDTHTLFIKIDGKDSALLIGKEGYRYKAISYLLFNWINYQYGLMIRLEIAEFLRSQEEMIANYLLPTIQTIKTTGKAQTKPLDGVLAHIALKQLREQFPDKYVAFRLNKQGERYIIVDTFYQS